MAVINSDNQSLLARRDLMILLLAVVGGSVDTLMIQSFSVLTAVQTANTILLAVDVVHYNLAAGLRSLVSLAGYISGVAIGELIIVRQNNSSSRFFRFSRTLVVELILLSCLLVCWILAKPEPSTGTAVVLVTLAALAMGIQSAAVLRLHFGSTTSNVTRMLTTFTTEFIWQLHLAEKEPVTSPFKHHRKFGRLFSKGSPWIYVITWIVYVMGAIVSGLLFLQVAEMTLFIPITAIIIVIIADTVP